MKISHECPRVMLEESREWNDFCYALVHKFQDDKEYLEFYKESLKQGRIVYLDNSLFELEEMFDHDEFAQWVKELGSINPDNFYYIIPDSLEEKDMTINSLKMFTENHKNLPGKSIGVVQGKTYDEIKECYRFMSENADTIAISFDYSYYVKTRPDERNKFFSWMCGRQELIDKLITEGVWNHDKEHHLLGCGLPQEFKHYKNIKSIVSCDTSNPIVMGLLGYRYDDLCGLDFKESIKLVDLFEAKLDEKQLENIHHNIKIFKSFAS